MKKIKIGIVGCGTIGSEIAKACLSRLKNKFELVALCDLDRNKATILAKDIKANIKISDLDELIRDVDLVVEAASSSMSAQVVEKAAAAGKNALVMSVGGLLGKEELLCKAMVSGVKVFIPSGALSGIDALKAASIGKIRSVMLTTRKPPKGLEGAPHLLAKGIDLDKIKSETVVFDGTAEEAVKGFPKNVNVCAVLSLAGIGAKKTRVRVVTSPEYKENVHEVEITGDFGRITTKTENVPSKANPKTSYMAILSAIATLDGIAESVRIGT